ncbi:PhzF family phenazine biosynthesis protein [Paroceanicella profunda]|uniref:PhzF family phenazine biosynthesis protein n=1 Tax=Paroceanicella profunda TaxID=2579971 RepID=A0A5B8FIH2_9RHOB|nr:PhzF family phenazine biosynthesis protein [Paroceanicella profunda]QDL93247.1 PhzF family phenazine biosynthesis protein [Paroceanicella profunda]
MTPISYVDVFSARPFLGNPVAVVLDGTGLDSARMQAIARWTNLSETTFCLPPEAPEADYRLRIFTPSCELPFAGHPTLGSAHALLQAGRVRPRDGVLVQECAVGLVRLTVTQGDARRSLAFDLPPARHQPLTDAEIAEAEACLGAPLLRGPWPEIVDVGPRWVVAELADAASLLGLEPQFQRLAALERQLGATGFTLYARHPEGAAAEIEVRSFAPSGGVEEDPVCGSGNGSVAAFRLAQGRISPDHVYLATQGSRMGRDGQIRVTLENGQVRIGGDCVSTVIGTLNLG